LHDPSYRKPLMEILEQRESLFTSPSFGAALVTLAKISQAESEEKKDDVRQLIEEFTNHPKKGIQFRALDALGELGDPRAISTLEAFGRSGDDIRKRAEQALKRLREQKPLVPAEVIELRQELAELKKVVDELRKSNGHLK
jgi:HEAT repeat protein